MQADIQGLFKNLVLVQEVTPAQKKYIPRSSPRDFYKVVDPVGLQTTIEV